ncbi:MAG: GIY-YIG nuclease family protein [Chitinophagaceae bacterium]|nr:MAG: GIY-YIG nuclease family protein [Chitinophagaceae bacterium]
MSFYVYIIQSLQDSSYYKGFSENPPLRLVRHNNGESRYTSGKVPWVLVYVEQLESKTSALKREKSLKKYSHDQLHSLIKTSKNIVNQFR